MVPRKSKSAYFQSLWLLASRCNFLLLMLVCPGCSYLKNKFSSSPGTSVIAATGGEYGVPFALEVNREAYDGKSLYLQGTIRPEIDYPASSVGLKLSGLKNAEVLSEQSFSLDQLLKLDASATLQAHESYQFVLSLEGLAIDDYQLEMDWDESADRLMAEQQLADSENKSALELENIKRDPRLRCKDQGACEVFYTVTANLLNRSQLALTHVRLGIGFVFIPNSDNDREGRLDLSAPIPEDSIPENEEAIELNNLTLQPGQRKLLKFNIAQGVPESSTGTFVPVLRVLSYE